MAARKTSLARGGSCLQRDQAGSEGRTDPRTHAPVHSSACTWRLGGLQNPCVAKCISSPAMHQDLLLISGTSQHPGLPTPPAARLVELKVVVKRMGLGCQSGSSPFLPDLKVHFQPTSDGQNALLVSQLASFRDEQQPFPPPGLGVPTLRPRPGCSAVLLGTAAWLPGSPPEHRGRGSASSPWG